MSAVAQAADAEPVAFDRDASQYEATRHLLNQLNKRKALTAEMVAEAIEEGDVDEQDIGKKGNLCLTLLHKWGAMAYEVVIDVEDKQVVTACERGR